MENELHPDYDALKFDPLENPIHTTVMNCLFWTVLEPMADGHQGTHQGHNRCAKFVSHVDLHELVRMASLLRRYTHQFMQIKKHYCIRTGAMAVNVFKLSWLRKCNQFAAPFDVLSTENVNQSKMYDCIDFFLPNYTRSRLSCDVFNINSFDFSGIAHQNQHNNKWILIKRAVYQK